MARTIFYEQANPEPRSMFTTPDQVIESERLSWREKMAILGHWEAETREAKARGGDPSGALAAFLHRVRAAQRLLAAHPEGVSLGTRAWR